jgi:hypothetical protein
VELHFHQMMRIKNDGVSQTGPYKRVH